MPLRALQIIKLLIYKNGRLEVKRFNRVKQPSIRIKTNVLKVKLKDDGSAEL